MRHEPSETPRLRLDLWLWRARFGRTRSRTQELIRAGHVRVNSVRTTDVARFVRPGDILTVALAKTTLVLRIEHLPETRGAAPLAQTCYALLEGQTRIDPDKM